MILILVPFMQIGRARESWQIHKHFHRFFDKPNHTFLFRLTNRSEHVVRKPSNFTMEIPTEANNAESKVEEFPVAMFITASSRRPASCSVTVVVEGHSLWT